jgi:hypothetical protein
MARFLPVLAVLLTASGAAAQQSPDFPRTKSYIIQLTSSQYSSGLGEYLIPPLTKAMRKTGMRYEGGHGAGYAATVEIGSDVGAWYGKGDAQEWLYQSTVTVGLSPADVDVEPEGRLTPSFSVTAKLLTPNADREDEMACLITLATREMAARYVPRGHVTVNGAGCARK